MVMPWGKAMWGHSKKVTVDKPEREFSPETKFADILILDFKSLVL